MHYSVYLVDLKIAVDAIMSNTNVKIFLGGGMPPDPPRKSYFAAWRCSHHHYYCYFQY